MNDAYKPYLKPTEIAKLLRVSQDKVLGWIRRAQLRAVNVSDSVRPRYRVSQESLDDFLKAREVVRPPVRQRRSRQPPKGGPIDPVPGEPLLKKGQAVKDGNVYYRLWDGIIQFF
jgi:excisionase family DNA binding protein